MTTTDDSLTRSGSAPSIGTPNLTTLMVTLHGDYSVSAPGSTVVFHDTYAVMNVDPATGQVVSFTLTKTVDLTGASDAS